MVFTEFQESIDIIENHDKNKPLFLYIPFMAIHSPIVGTPPKRFVSICGSYKRKINRFRHLYNASLDGEYGHQDDLRDVAIEVTDHAVHKVI